MSYEITGDIEEMRELTKGLKAAEPALRKATVSALNKTARSVRAEIGRMVSKKYKITQKAVKAELAISKAHFNRLEAIILGEGSPGIPLIKFFPTPKRVPSTIHKPGRWESRFTWWGEQLKRQVMIPGTDRYLPKAGIKVMIHRGDRKVIRGAFIARMPSGHVGVFKRQDSGMGAWWNSFSGRGIKELFGPSPLRIISSDAFQIPLDDFTGETLDKNMAHEASFFLKKAGVLPGV